MLSIGFFLNKPAMRIILWTLFTTLSIVNVATSGQLVSGGSSNFSCPTNFCQNGGICYGTNDDSSAMPEYCPDGSILFAHGCYKVHREKKNWSQAADYCARSNESLVTAHDITERLFLENFARGQDLPGRPHVWSGGIANQSAVFIWADSGEHVNLTIFDMKMTRYPRQTFTPGNMTRRIKSSLLPARDQRILCLALDGSANYTSWIMTSCTEANFPFICRRKAERWPDLLGTFPHQCQCGLEFEGLECEKKLDTGVVSYGYGLKCADDVAALSCPSEPQDLRIEIEYAMYGVIVNQRAVCTAHSTGEMAVFDPQCSLPAVKYLRENCQGRKDCIVKMSAADFRVDPCPATPKQLQYRYRCVDKTHSCGANQFYVNNACYEVYNTNNKATWNEARSYCQVYGGQLPVVTAAEAEGIMREAVVTDRTGYGQKSRFNGEKRVNLWLIYREAGESADQLGNLSEAVNNQSLGKYTDRSRDKCAAYNVKLGRSLEKSEVAWSSVNCNRKLGWICKFPTFSLAESIPLTGENVSVHSRSVAQTNYPKSAFPGNFMSTVVPPLNLTFPTITPIPQIPWFTNVLTFPTMHPPSDRITAFTVVNNGQEETGLQFATTPAPVPDSSMCESRLIKDHVWGKTEPGFVIQPCSDPKPSSRISISLIENVRHVVQMYASDQSSQFDKNVENYPYGFSFWMCTKKDNESKPRYYPESGPVDDLCTAAATPAITVTTLMTTTDEPVAVLKATAQQFANYTSSGSMNGSEILEACNFLQGLLSEKQRQSKAAARTMDFDQTFATTEEFVNVVSQSVSNMLADNHKRGWIELDDDQRSDAATSLMKAAEDSTFLLANISPEQIRNTSSFQKRLQYENIDIQVVVLPAQTIDAPMTFTSVSADPNSSNEISDQSDALFDVIELPPSIKNFSDKQGNVRVSFIQYSLTLSALLAPQNNTLNATNSTTGQLIVNSKVLSATVLDSNNQRQSVSLDEETVTLTFKNTFTNGSAATCVFWNMRDPTNSFWDVTGCSLVDHLSNSTHTVCRCSHLTNFAVLMDINGALATLGKKDRLALNIISYIGCIISIVCLILCLIIFTFFRSLWCDRVTIHRNLTFCLLIAQFVFVLGVDRVHNQIGCAITAGILHYTLLAAFAWMLLEGLQLYMMLVQVFEAEESRKVWYYAFGYGLPGIIVSVAAGIRPDHYGTDKYCWLLPNDGFVWSFAGPVLAIVCVNTVFLVIALLTVFRVRNPVRKQNNLEKMKGWLRGSVMLLCLLGTTWLFGFLYISHASTLVFAYLFTICNSLQGFFIFVFHCVMNEKVFGTVQRYIRRCSWCPQWCKDCIGTPKSSKSSSGKESSSQSHQGSMVWNFLKLRRLSHESSISSQSAIAKQLSTESDYLSKSSSFKSNKSRRGQRPPINHHNGLNNISDMTTEIALKKPGRARTEYNANSGGTRV
ncbi:adhesion G protein-coupled receptor L3-like isoform X2 [Paramacrobiotus metropolitanus]|uniref:adhesion G protein-coupled receptor L3-like isoform X2 n=1 Tax=Paramacrobiotus metropolitanus TaxID=2943436 RepID=UPI0024460CC7|nr:adhesion G protein-coupled receptor L3-like isoform X2 [Paramacrobiotus metropolitanus]